MDKRVNKMDNETLQQFLAFRKRAGRVPAKKGKGSYSRKEFKKGWQKVLTVKKFWVEDEELEMIKAVAELIDGVTDAMNESIIDWDCPVPCDSGNLNAFADWLDRNRQVI